MFSFVHHTYTHRHTPKEMFYKLITSARLAHAYTCIHLLGRTQLHFIQNNTDYRMRLSTIRIIQFNVMVSVLPFLHFRCLLCLSVFFFNIISPKCEITRKTAANFPFFYRHFFLLLPLLRFHLFIWFICDFS